MPQFIFAICTLIWFGGLPAWAQATDSTLDRIATQLAQHRVAPAAIDELAQIINRDPKNYHAHIIMGNYCDYLGLPEQAMEQYRLAFKYGPNEPKACLNLIKALVEAGQVTAASNLLKQAEQKFPTDPYVLLLVGNANFREGKYVEAEDLYQRAMTAAKQLILGLNTALAAVRLKENNYIAAFNLAKKDLDIDSSFPPANEIAGLALMKIGQYERAMPYLKLAFKNSSPSFTLVFDYTQSLIWCGKYSQALLPSLSSLALTGNQEERNMVLKAINQINFHLSKNVVQKAAQDLNIYRVARNSAIAHSQMAKICLDKGLVNLAVSQSALAAKLAPGSAEAMYELALILETYRHNYPAALKCLRQAHALAANDYQISQHLMRLEDRLAMRNADWSWQFKNWISAK